MASDRSGKRSGAGVDVSHPESKRPIGAVTIAVIAACAVAITASAWVLLRDATSRHAEAMVAEQDRALTMGTPDAFATVEPVPLDAPDRALLANALLLARSVPPASAGSEAQRVTLERALTQTLLVIRKHPRWGDAWALAAFVYSRRDGPTADTALSALTQSYRYAPFLRSAGPWRFATALASWDALNAETRSNAVAEGVWLARLDPRLNRDVLQLVRSSDAYGDFMIQLLATHRLDVGSDQP